MKTLFYFIHSCRRSLAKNPDNHFLTDDSNDQHTVLPPLNLDGTNQFMCEPHFDSKQKQDASTKHSSQICHLNLEGEINYVPEYRSQFITFPIEKSHSIPQLSNIKFQGKFIGVPEYRDSFKEYDQYAKSAPIKKPDHLTVRGNMDNTAEYADKYKTPDKITVERTVLAKKGEQFHLLGEDTVRIAEYSESFKDPKITVFPERAKARQSILSLKGNMDYSPEYR